MTTPRPPRQATAATANATIVDLTSLPAVPCPCGLARRAFAGDRRFPGTLHLTQIRTDAVAHHHEHHTETYVVLDCAPGAEIELDGVRHPVGPRTAVLIPPGVLHRAIGEMTVLIVCTPDFDADDEVLADETLADEVLADEVL